MLRQVRLSPDALRALRILYMHKGWREAKRLRAVILGKRPDGL